MLHADPARVGRSLAPAAKSVAVSEIALTGVYEISKILTSANRLAASERSASMMPLRMSPSPDWFDDIEPLASTKPASPCDLSVYPTDREVHLGKTPRGILISP